MLPPADISEQQLQVAVRHEELLDAGRNLLEGLKTADEDCADIVQPLLVAPVVATNMLALHGDPIRFDPTERCSAFELLLMLIEGIGDVEKVSNRLIERLDRVLDSLDDHRVRNSPLGPLLVALQEARTRELEAISAHQSRMVHARHEAMGLIRAMYPDPARMEPPP